VERAATLESWRLTGSNACPHGDKLGFGWLLHSNAHRGRTMKRRKGLCGILTFCAFAAMTASSQQAQARACVQGGDCPGGWYCDKANAGAGDGGPTGTCMSLPCQSNSDCGPVLSCFTEGWSLGPGLPVSATTPSLFPGDGGKGSACIPQWDVACTSASDCGPGFTCPPRSGGFGGSFNCGKDQDASEPPYATVTTVPCSAAMPPILFGDAGLPAGFHIPSICEAGTTCTEVSWNNCMAPQTTPCSVDSDCPSMWTCGCETNCNGPVLTPDGSCTMVCMAPDSDLFAGEVCFGGAAAGSFGPGGSTPAPSSPAAPDSGAGTGGSSASPGATGHGGCQIDSGDTGASGALMAAGLLAAATWRSRRRRSSSPRATPLPCVSSTRSHAGSGRHRAGAGIASFETTRGGLRPGEFLNQPWSGPPPRRPVSRSKTP
jgi:MYXO-CTERM domain-containing protein